MKKLLFLLSLILLSFPTQASEIWYSSGLSSDWNDPQSWNMDSAESGQEGVPGANDIVVLRHPMTFILKNTYVHGGNLLIENEGILEVVGFGDRAVFVFEGKEWKNEGILISNLPILIRTHGETPSRLVLGEGSQTMFGASLSLIGSHLDIQNGSCGAFFIQGELHLHGNEVLIAGQGAWVAELGFRVWVNVEEELTDPLAKNIFLATVMHRGLSLYTQLADCNAGQNSVAGTYDPSDAADHNEAKPASVHMVMYPNPQNMESQLQLKATGFEAGEVIQIEVRNLLGQPMLSQSTLSSEMGEVAVSTYWNLDQGHYLVSLRGTHQVATQRLVRQ